ncbi:MAG: hypothetical protein U0165_01550 [Polyangiaceae bacterium]
MTGARHSPLFRFFRRRSHVASRLDQHGIYKELWRANVVGFSDLAMVLVWNVLYALGRVNEVEIWHKSVERLFGKEEVPIRALRGCSSTLRSASALRRSAR